MLQLNVKMHFEFGVLITTIIERNIIMSLLLLKTIWHQLDNKSFRILWNTLSLQLI